MKLNQNELINPIPQDSQTEIKEFGDLVPGDKIMGADGAPVTVTNVYEKHFPNNMYELEMEDGEVVQASGNHLWYCETSNDFNDKEEYKRLAKVYFENKAVPEKEVEDIYADLKELITVFGQEVSTQLFIEKVSKSLGHSRVGPHLILDGNLVHKEDLKYYSYNDLIDFLIQMKKAVLDNEGYFFFGQVRETDTIAHLMANDQSVNIPHKSDMLK